MKVHPVFHITLVKKWNLDPHGHDPPQPPPIVTAEGEVEYIIEKMEKIASSKKVGRKIEYSIKWEG